MFSGAHSEDRAVHLELRPGTPSRGQENKDVEFAISVVVYNVGICKVGVESDPNVFDGLPREFVLEFADRKGRRNLELCLKPPRVARQQVWIVAKCDVGGETCRIAQFPVWIGTEDDDEQE